MKHFNKLLLAACTAALLGACSKKDSPAPSSTTTPPDSSATATSSKKISERLLEAKWEATGIYTITYDAGNHVTDISGVSRTYHHDGVYWADSLTTYITFNADNSYSITDKTGAAHSIMYREISPLSGAWSVNSDSTVLTLPILPSGTLDLKVVSFSTSKVDLCDSLPGSGVNYATHFVFEK